MLNTFEERIKNAQVLVPIQDLTNIFRDLIREELNAKNERDLQEKFLSPEDTCKVFQPAITKPTLESYVRKGLLKKYYLGGRTWFKYSELSEAMKEIKKILPQQYYTNMTVNKFNSLSLEDKWLFIRENLGDQSYGAVNDLCFPYMIIYFQMVLSTGQLLTATAEFMPPKYREEIQREYPDFKCFLFTHDNTPLVKNYYFNAINRLGKKYN